MKTNLLLSVRNAFYVTFSFLLLVSCTPDYSNDQDDDYEDIEGEIDQVLFNFGTSLAEKDDEVQRSLFLSSSSALNFVIKNPEAPFVFGFPRDEWIGFFESWDYEYFPEYSNKEFYIGKGMVIQSIDFQGYKNEVPDSFGKDLFAYVQTATGWKIVGVSSSITSPGDATDYGANFPIQTTPSVAIDAFVEGFNEQNQELFATAFINLMAPCFQFNTTFDVSYADDLHSATAFYANVPNAVSGLKIKLVGAEIVETDQFTALVSAAYSIRKDGNKYEKGQMLATMVATPADGWKITNMLLSKL